MNVPGGPSGPSAACARPHPGALPCTPYNLQVSPAMDAPDAAAAAAFRHARLGTVHDGRLSVVALLESAAGLHDPAIWIGEVLLASPREAHRALARRARDTVHRASDRPRPTRSRPARCGCPWPPPARSARGRCLPATPVPDSGCPGGHPPTRCDPCPLRRHRQRFAGIRRGVVQSVARLPPAHEATFEASTAFAVATTCSTVNP
jgi:hypothetical protein